MRSPGITTKINGKPKTLYMPSVPMLELQTRENLDKSLIDLGFTDGQELVVADVTSPSAKILVVRFDGNWSGAQNQPFSPSRKKCDASVS